MSSPLPPDPYAALGVSKNVDAATIKSTYRKLVLRCHPDKVTDESLKQQKQEEFHKIQQAYELVGDEEKRATYDAEVRLNELRKEKLMRTGGSVDIKTGTGHYEVRTAAPAGATFTRSSTARYEERKPSRSYDDDRRHKDRSTDYDTYDAFPKRSPPRSSREKESTSRAAKVSTDRTRSDHKKTRDREERRERSSKFPWAEDDTSSSADEKARYEADYRRRAEEELAKKEAAEARRRADDRRSYEEPRRHRAEDRESYEYDRQRKMEERKNEALHYMSRAKGVESDRPSPVRIVSSRDVRAEQHQDSRRRGERPDLAPRRSSARPKESSSHPTASVRDSGRDRKGIPEIVEWDNADRDRKMPAFKHSSSSPAEIHVPPRTIPQRSYTEAPIREHRRTDTSPTPAFRRTESMPINSSSYGASSSRRKEATPSRSSGLRTSETVPSAAIPEIFPTVPPTSSRKVYHYPSPTGGVRHPSEDVNVANGHRTILREPGHRGRSPSPLSKPPMGSNRPVVAPAPPRVTPMTVPPLMRSATTVSPSRVEERGRKLYGEVSGPGRKASYSPDNIQYTRKYGPEDIQWAGPRGRTSDRDYLGAKPMLSRNATFAY
ncbi:hypothetical protein BCR34DRAFT_478722 [Clohesyomyces aquaticus]|uniref:J domain-containing protein n=1 Tax=Clohesyomyces aquaticus TaxID=1231657 RepID=A0A1Y1ZXE0_9PLEO|nr:hypothetical protein BCR34DRAFT_478722 [Clohesyomyces aquaticus]